MLLLDRESSGTLPDLNGRESRLRLHVPSDGQLFDLTTGKTTIGSSPRCNVRIQKPGVQPLHCLIAPGPEGVRVR
ncbi:MAG TPA: hypothetical protein VHE81_19730, partial [Lacipirellulaceae bacterium]|nr:hypothetical protein [Lacipirellulaceae bacterium]